MLVHIVPNTPGTTVILVTVHQWTNQVIVSCTFQHTLSDKCYVQVVSDIMNGFHEGEYLEGEEDASHSFTGLVPGTYSILVYGVGREEVSCSLHRDPDYITVVNVNTTEHAAVTTVPVITPEPSMFARHA